MKQYIYQPREVGLDLDDWPSGTLRLDGIEQTRNPDEADIFVCPGSLMMFQNPTSLDRFPFMKGREERHVFFDVSDYEMQYGKPCIFIRCNTRDWYFKNDPNTISFAWPVEDYAECVDVPAGGFTYDVSFQAWLSSIARKQAARSCLETTRLRSDIAGYSDFTGYLKADDPELARRRAEFRRSMRESRVALCPESIPGVFPYRFFEAMSAGRVPLLVGTGYVFPFSDEIPYKDFSIALPTSEASRAGQFIVEFLDVHNDEELVHMGKMARHFWKEFLNSADWPKSMAKVAVAKLNSLGLVKCA